MTERDELVAWLADMPDADVEALWAVASRLRVTMAPPPDPELAGLPDWLVNAPVDDEPLSDEFLARMAEAEADVAAGRVTPGKEVFRRLMA